jgi:ParB-like chromosome segregation protein Spo0J
MLETHSIRLDEIYVPVKLKKTLDASKVDSLAESILEKGLEVPIQIRRDDAKGRYVLVSGFHRLEAVRALGEEAVDAIIVTARKF